MKKILSYIICLLVFTTMFLTTLWASYQVDLFEVLSSYWAMPWFRATLVDFYLNQYLILFFVYLVERKVFNVLIWFVLFSCFGSMGSAIYLMTLIYRNYNFNNLKIGEKL